MIKSITSQYLAGFIGLVCLAAFIFIDSKDQRFDLTSIIPGVQERFQAKEKEARLQLDEFIESCEQKSGAESFETISKTQMVELSEQGIFLFRFVDDTMRFWSDNSVPLGALFSNSGLKPGLNHLDNGWYFAVLKTRNNSVYISLSLLKNTYNIDNSFLNNSFQREFGIPDYVRIDSVGLPGSAVVQSVGGKPAFFLSVENPNNPQSQSGISLWISLALFIVAIILLFSVLKNGAHKIEQRFGWLAAMVFYVLALFALRYASIVFTYPQTFYTLDFFSPANYATSALLSSLGDFFLNSIVVFYAMLIISNTLKDKFLNSAVPADRTSSKLSFKNTGIGTAFMLICFGLFSFYHFLFEGLVLNSNISFNVNNFFELTIYSFFAFASMGLLLFSLFLWIDFTAHYLYRHSTVLQISALALGGIIYVVFALFLKLPLTWATALPLLVLVLLLLNLKSNHTIASELTSDSYPLTTVLLILIAGSIYVSQLTFFKSEIREKAQRELLADKLSAEKDQIAEYFFGEIANKIKTDTLLKRLAQEDSIVPGQLATRLKEKHLTAFWRKYDLQVTVCGEFDSLLVEADNVLWNCNEFFGTQIRSFGQPTGVPELYFMDNNNGRISYLAKIGFDNVSLYLELDSKLIPDELGFPDLLLDFEGIDQVRSGLKKYSYAKYIDKILVDQSGDFKYNTSLAFSTNAASNEYLNYNGYNHLIHEINENSTIILSKQSTGILDALVRFSYLFAFSCLGAIMFYAARSNRIRLLFTEINFQKRIQYSMILILLVSLVPIGLGTKYYIENQYNTRNQENIKEKIQSVLIEVEHKLANETAINSTLEDYLAFILTKFSYVFFTDINLFDLDGNLLATSRPEMFDQGLIGTKMNVVAFIEMSGNKQTEFVHKERVGSLEFLSAYVPFRNENNEVLAYLNLPYFAKESNLQKEISTFLVALINFYVMLIIGAVFIAIFLSNNITNPLRLIQQKLATIRVGQQNEPIEWKSKDEIGALVHEYNRMIDELSRSAELLAKSERESAWREMAKQVAHEIKNPLTPMKLSVQHLERAWEDNAPDWDKRLKKFTKTIIQQIDTLSTIATEFSDFAAMPRANIQTIDLAQVVNDVIELYNDKDHAKITQKTTGLNEENEAPVSADREQIIRVLNNLIINAIQATSSNGEIIIEVKIENQACIVSIQDDGIGIPESEKDKIFTPSFTTKTSGKGLGLAIVKSIVENTGGAVWFESEEGKGSTFYFSMPRSE